jgi:type I restriction enzyme R subunit
LLRASLNRYSARAIETAQVIEELIAMAKQFAEAAAKGAALGLNPEELSFYDALVTDEASVKELGDDILKKIAQELVQKLRSSVSVDWSKREAVQA